VSELLADIAPEVADVVSLMVSELATNCVLYVDSDFTVAVAREGRAVRIDVRDEGDGVVTLRDPKPTDPNGRGLRIVQKLSDEWGVQEDVDHHGKSVWFTIRL
jgi:anti-sigma regulatory factor (Ser/Thr protein kinase)